MDIGIVGSEGAKFTPVTEEAARIIIRELIAPYNKVVSGACHLGGIDLWAIEEAKAAGKEYVEFPPKFKTWEYYKKRNLQIATYADIVVCITVKDLPPGYKEKGFERYCYHCNTDQHIKSGGCWTVKQAIRKGKYGRVIVIGEPSDSRSKEIQPE
jgi:hypothetical protein